MTTTNASTPLMKQYLEIKSKFEDAVLFFRMGDFYEMFYEDAKIASEVLGITLTARSGGKAGPVPLAGFPYHSLDNHLSKMVKAGRRVAICEQVEDPKKAKNIVKRAVTEIVTPGTTLADNLLDSRRNNFLCAVALKEKNAGVATVDNSTGEFRVAEVPIDKIADTLALIAPAEILVADDQRQALEVMLKSGVDSVVSDCDSWLFNYDYCYEKLTGHFKTLTLKGFGVDDFNAGICAAGAAISYLKENQKRELEHIVALTRDEEDTYVVLDRSTRRNLELVHSLSGAKKGTLLSVLDRTRTPMGARQLVGWLARPLRKVSEINKRLDAIEELVNEKQVQGELQDVLGGIGDIERLNAKVTTQRANARDLIAIAASLEKFVPISELLANFESKKLGELIADLQLLPDVVAEIKNAISENPPLAITEGGFIKKGYHQELDALKEIAFSGKDWILRLQESEREKTGIPSLKVNYNKVFGYYIEVTKANLSKAPEHYIRKQTLVNAERFITPELKEYEEQILGAQEKMISLEYELFNKVRSFVARYGAQIQKNARVIAEIDCLSTFALLAVENGYSRPVLDNGSSISIKDGWHPVIEKLLPFGEKFVPNDTEIDSKSSQIQIITGPNMAGKSTYLRQVALIVLMAQMGSYVPAKRAQIGTVDKIFTRVGASDNIASGESTFLVEMNETANILNNSSANSLILLDEIGRGTSTFDGLSIAWAVVEYLHEYEKIAAKTMFATHYHELTELEMIFDRIKNYNIAVKEWGDKIIFLRKIIPGGADHSYGIQVAKLAGLPAPIIARAKEILSNLEQNALTPNHKPKIALKRKAGKRVNDSGQMDIFGKKDESVLVDIKNADVNNMTPMQALIKLTEMKEKIQKSS